MVEIISTTPPQAPPPARLYALVGADMEETAKALPGNVIVIRARPDQSLESAVRSIQPPANLFLLAHGTENGTFQWNTKQDVPYGKLFAALPRTGIDSITLNSCYGASAEAEAFLKTAPAGTMVQSMVGAKTLGWNMTDLSFAEELGRNSSKIDIFLKVLDNFDPQSVMDATQWHNKNKNERNDANPEHALPHIIGMGGKPPLRIDLALETDRLSSKTTRFSATDENLWHASIARVQGQFDTRHWVANRNANDMHRQDLGPEGEKALDARIAQVALMVRNGEKLSTGSPVENAENKRIAYALTASYLDSSGQFDRWTAQQMPHALPPVTKAPAPPSAGLPPAVDVSGLPALKHVIHEQHGLVSSTRQSTPTTQEVVAFARLFGIAGVDTDTVLTAKEIRAVQAALHVGKDGLIGAKTLAAMEKSVSEGHLPPAHTPLTRPIIEHGKG